MDTEQLATLREVAAAGSVTAAARVLHRTPSAVSQQLRALERATGTPLTERVGRGIRLTQAGQTLAASAVEVAVALERAEAAIARFGASPGGTVSVTAFQSAARMLFAPLLTRLRDRPEIAVECAESDVARAEFPPLTAEYDIVVAHRPDRSPDWPSGVEVFPLLREPLDVAVPLDHPLAGRARVTPGELGDLDWIAVHVGYPLADVLDEIAARAGTTARIAHRLNDFGVVEAMVAAGHGVALLPRYSASTAAGGLALVPLAGVRAGRRIDALLRPDRAERVVVRAVLRQLRAAARELQSRDRAV